MTIPMQAIFIHETRRTKIAQARDKNTPYIPTLTQTTFQISTVQKKPQ